MGHRLGLEILRQEPGDQLFDSGAMAGLGDVVNLGFQRGQSIGYGGGKAANVEESVIVFRVTDPCDVRWREL